jgi:hypothetical protein
MHALEETDGTSVDKLRHTSEHLTVVQSIHRLPMARQQRSQPPDVDIPEQKDQCFRAAMRATFDRGPRAKRIANGVLRQARYARRTAQRKFLANAREHHAHVGERVERPTGAIGRR